MESFRSSSAKKPKKPTLSRTIKVGLAVIGAYCLGVGTTILADRTGLMENTILGDLTHGTLEESFGEYAEQKQREELEMAITLLTIKNACLNAVETAYIMGPPKNIEPFDLDGNGVPEGYIGTNGMGNPVRFYLEPDGTYQFRPDLEFMNMSREPEPFAQPKIKPQF